MMKVVAKPIEVIAIFDADGNIKPYRFRIQEEDEYAVYNVSKVIESKKEKFCGRPMITYSCQSSINNYMRRYELKFDVEGCKWILYKI